MAALYSFFFSAAEYASTACSGEDARAGAPGDSPPEAPAVTAYKTRPAHATHGRHRSNMSDTSLRNPARRRKVSSAAGSRGRGAELRESLSRVAGPLQRLVRLAVTNLE